MDPIENFATMITCVLEFNQIEQALALNPELKSGPRVSMVEVQNLASKESLEGKRQSMQSLGANSQISKVSAKVGVQAQYKTINQNENSMESLDPKP